MTVRPDLIKTPAGDALQVFRLKKLTDAASFAYVEVVEAVFEKTIEEIILSLEKYTKYANATTTNEN